MYLSPPAPHPCSSIHTDLLELGSASSDGVVLCCRLAGQIKRRSSRDSLSSHHHKGQPPSRFSTTCEAKPWTGTGWHPLPSMNQVLGELSESVPKDRDSSAWADNLPETAWGHFSPTVATQCLYTVLWSTQRGDRPSANWMMTAQLSEIKMYRPGQKGTFLALASFTKNAHFTHRNWAICMNSRAECGKADWNSPL